MTINRSVSRTELAAKVRGLRSSGVEFRYLHCSTGTVDLMWSVGSGNRMYTAPRKVVA
jgi:hypothetical protein